MTYEKLSFSNAVTSVYCKLLVHSCTSNRYIGSS